MTEKDDMFWVGLNAVAGERGREICIASRKGSYIYGVNHASSDQDFHMFVFPTVMELIREKMYVGHVTNGDDGRDLEGTIHDVRRLPEFLRKMNPTIMEMLSPKALTSFYSYDLLHWWHENRGRLLFGNRTAFVMSCAGSFNERVKKLTSGTVTTQDAVNRLGYDPKQAAHAYRYAVLASRYSEFVMGGRSSLVTENDMADSLFDLVEGSACRKVFDTLKNSGLPIEQVKDILDCASLSLDAACKNAKTFANDGTVYSEFEELLVYTIERWIRFNQ